MAPAAGGAAGAPWPGDQREGLANLTAQWGQEYTSYDRLTDVLDRLASLCGPIFRSLSIGRSVEGRELWVARLTDNPDEHEGEPEFLYAAGIHGDEPPGRELLLRLAEDLCVKYAEGDQHIRELVDSTDIYLLFAVNPDGTEHRVRTNAHQVDLNRNFPDQVHASPSTMEPETQALVSFLREHRFALGANFHTGALCCNYPWDERSNGDMSVLIRSFAPDNRLLRHLCEVYSDAHPNMHTSPEFTEGITNGAAWYTLYGGLQDFAYSQVGMLHTTIELGYPKAPPAATLAAEWSRNSRALYAYMEQVHVGARGRIVCTCQEGDVQRSLPSNASLTFTRLGREDKAPADLPLVQEIRTWANPDTGDYHRVLLPGSYQVDVEGCGGASSSAQIVVHGPATARRPGGLPATSVADFAMSAPRCPGQPSAAAGGMPPLVSAAWAAAAGEGDGFLSASAVGQGGGWEAVGRRAAALSPVTVAVLLVLVALAAAGFFLRRWTGRQHQDGGGSAHKFLLVTGSNELASQEGRPADASRRLTDGAQGSSRGDAAGPDDI